jgi:uncharacterized integral membrane protein
VAAVKRFAWIVAVLALSVIAILFTVFNTSVVDIKLGLWAGAMPVFAAVLASLFFGVVAGACIAWFAGHDRRRRARELARRNSLLLRQIDELRRAQPTERANVIDGQSQRAKLVASR